MVSKNSAKRLTQSPKDLLIPDQCPTCLVSWSAEVRTAVCEESSVLIGRNLEKTIGNSTPQCKQRPECKHPRTNMTRKNQSGRLTTQHVASGGAEGIFGKEAKKHDLKVDEVARLLVKKLEEQHPLFHFRYRESVTKAEISKALQKVDPSLGKELFVTNSSIRPDGGLIEVQDDNGDWRIVLVSEAKHQGNDIENIRRGELVGKKKDQDLMAAGNAIERSHKNISEIANLMLAESHFPYVLFLECSNFLTETITVERPDGRSVVLQYNSGMLNRLDRLTSANYGLPINTNLCENKFVAHKEKSIMLQAASIFTQGDGGEWDSDEMMEIMFDVAQTSIRILFSDMFIQVTGKSK